MLATSPKTRAARGDVLRFLREERHLSPRRRASSLASPPLAALLCYGHASPPLAALLC